MKNQITKGSYLAPTTEVIQVRIESGMLTDSMQVSGATSGVQNYDMEEI